MYYVIGASVSSLHRESTDSLIYLDQNNKCAMLLLHIYITMLTVAQFIVHVKGPGVIALQNKKKPKQWLRIMDDELNAKVTTHTHTDYLSVYNLV